MLLFQLVDWIWNTITEIFQLIFGPFTDPKGANGGGVVGSKELVPMYPSFYTFNPFPHQKHHRKKSEDYELGEGDVGQHEGLDANGMANELHWKQLNNHHHNHHHQAQFYPPPHPALPTATSSHLPQHAHLLYRHFPVHSPHGQYVSIPANLPPSPVHPSHLQVTPTGSPSVNGLPRPHGSISGTEEHSLNPHAVKRRGSKSTANNLVTPSARMSPEVSKGLRKHFGEDFHNNLTKNMNITNHVFVDTVPSLLQKQTSKELSPLHYQSDQQQTSSNMFQHHPDDNMSNIHTFNRGIRGSQPLVSLNRLSLLAKENNHESTRYLELDEGEHPYSQSSSNHDIVIPMASETMSATDPIAALANMSLLLPIIPYDELRGLSDTRNRIGGGAFGSVYKGMWRGTPVAIKLLTGIDNVNAEETAMANKVLQAFVEEVTMLARLRHPNICLLLGVCVEPHHKAIVTEIVSRGSLWDAIRIRQPFQNEQHPNKIFYWPTHIIRRVLEGAGRGLVYLHNHNPPIIHRDLKSANILLDDSYNVKICDFGLAKLRDLTTTLTANVGTVQWMAPEVLTGNQYHQSVDIFSMALVAWEMMTGKCPYEGMKQVEVALAVINHNHRPTLPSNCTFEQRSFIQRCWSTKPEERPTAEDFVYETAHVFHS